MVDTKGSLIGPEKEGKNPATQTPNFKKKYESALVRNNELKKEKEDLNAQIELLENENRKNRSDNEDLSSRSKILESEIFAAIKENQEILEQNRKLSTDHDNIIGNLKSELWKKEFKIITLGTRDGSLEEDKKNADILFKNVDARYKKLKIEFERLQISYLETMKNLETQAALYESKIKDLEFQINLNSTKKQECKGLNNTPQTPKSNNRAASSNLKIKIFAILLAVIVLIIFGAIYILRNLKNWKYLADNRATQAIN